MRNLTIHLALALCLFASTLVAQDDKKKENPGYSERVEQTGPTFEMRAKMIASKIDAITKEEKAALKAEVDDVNKELDAGKLTGQQADERKLKLAEIRAKNIETRVADAQSELNQLVKDRVDGKIKEQDSTRIYMWKFDTRRQNKELNGETRTTSQFVIAAGVNNLVTDGAVANSDFAYLRSCFYEWGVTYNTRILKDNNLLHFKYGVTGVYNILSITDNRYFVDVGNQTVLATHPEYLRRKDSYFKNVFITIPVHLEFDFSKAEIRDDKKYFKTHQGFRLGLGGFVGYNTNSKQFLSYEVDGYRIKERQKGNWNISDWNYGLSAYIGWKETSLYLKYDLNPMFENNDVEQHNISLGARFDLN
jgi:hypothetical protein